MRLQLVLVGLVVSGVSAFNVAPKRTPFTQLGAVGIDPNKSGDFMAKRRKRASDESREPAGVAAHMFSRPRALGASLKRGQRRARHFLVRRKWRWRHLSEQHTTQKVIDANVLSSTKDLDVPDWACVDKGEQQRLATMKALLEPEFALLEDKTVKLNGKKVQVIQAFPDVYGDLRLLRFLRKDKVQNPESAANRYRNFLAWRRESDVDANVRVLVEKQPFSPPPKLNELLKDLVPCDFHVESGGSEDTIAATLNVGRWDTTEIYNLIHQNKLTLSEFLVYWTHLFESLNWKLHQEMLKRERMVYLDEICDLGGMSMRQFSPGFLSHLLKPWMHLTQGNYPETTKHIIFLNPPRIISFIWNLVAPIVSPGTLEKIQFKRKFKGSCMDNVGETTD